MQPWHRPWLDASREAVADNKVITSAKAFDERPDLAEVVAVVGVAHDDEFAIRRLDAADERRAVALTRHIDDARTQLSCDDRRTVGAAVVGDDHLGRDPKLLGRTLRFLDAASDGFGLVEAGHDDRDFEGGARAAVLSLGFSRDDLHLPVPSNVSLGANANSMAHRIGTQDPKVSSPPTHCK